MNGIEVLSGGTGATSLDTGDRTPRDASSASAAEKVLYVLTAFEQRSHWALQDLAGHLGMPKSTVHRLLGTLKSMQFIDQDPSDSRYHLGFRLWTLARRSRDFDALAAAAQPILQDLVDRTGETAFMMVRDGLHALCIARVNTPQEVRLLIDVGTASPLHLGASNSVVLAFLEDAERSSILARTVVQPELRAQAKQEMRSVARAGFAYTSSQLTPGAAAIGVPVRGADGRVLAGLSIGAPAYRFDRERALTMLPSLQHAADSLARRFGRGQQPDRRMAD
ncbi:MAG: IclR family transcriptional regulator [Trueperaceae bacterium]